MLYLIQKALILPCYIRTVQPVVPLARGCARSQWCRVTSGLGSDGLIPEGGGIDELSMHRGQAKGVPVSGLEQHQPIDRTSLRTRLRDTGAGSRKKTVESLVTPASAKYYHTPRTMALPLSLYSH
eukprot:358445-Chlamydomonas_euryale.AAC.23